MKMKLLCILLICGIMASICPSSAYGHTAAAQPSKEEVRDAISTLRNFYVPYTYNKLNLQDDSDANNLLIHRYMTQTLITKIKSTISATYANPIVRAQDFNDEAFRTLRFEHRSDDWYIVSYKWYPTDSVRTKIPFQVHKIKGEYMIVDIEFEPRFILKK